MSPAPTTDTPDSATPTRIGLTYPLAVYQSIAVPF